MTTEPPVRVCSTCGRSILADAEFCPHCGARNQKPGRSAFGTVLDRLVTALIVVVAILFGLAGACFLLVGLGSGAGAKPGISFFMVLAIGIVLLVAAWRLMAYVRRRREARR